MLVQSENKYYTNICFVLAFALFLNASCGLISNTGILPFSLLNILTRVNVFIMIFFIMLKVKCFRITPFFIPFVVFLILLGLLVNIVNPSLPVYNYIDYELIRYSGIIILSFVYFRKMKMIFYVNILLMFYLLFNIANIFQIFMGDFSRVSSILGASYNYVSAINLVSLPIFINLLFYGEKLINNRTKTWLFFCVFLMLLVIIYSGSRSAYFFLSIILIYTVILFFKKLKFINAIFVSIICTTMYSILIKSELFSEMFSRVFRDDVIEDASRTEIYENSINIIKEHLFLGVGNPKVVYVGSELSYSHNFVIEAFLISGCIGFFIFVLYHVSVIRFIFIGNRIQIDNKLLFLIILIFFGTSLFHPFITSSFLINILYIFNLLLLNKLMVEKYEK